MDPGNSPPDTKAAVETVKSKRWNVSTDPYVTETTERWTAVDAFAVPRLHYPGKPYHGAIENAASHSTERGLEDIAVGPTQGKFLQVQCKLLKARNVLEVGTLGAYSTIWMASASPDIKVVSIEIDPGVAEIARENIKAAGMERQLEILVGSALRILPELAKDVKEGRREPFDFSFIDADKREALDYFTWAKTMSREGAGVYLDNMVRKGLLADEELAAKGDENVQAIRRTIEEIGKMDGVEATLLQTVSEKNYDGFLLAVVNTV